MGVTDREAVQRAFDLCSWGNSHETASDWFEQLSGTDETAKKRLFSRLFIESPDGEDIKKLFTKEQIREYLTDFNKPLARKHLEKRRKVWRYLYLGERVPIPELDWTISSRE
jgi:hypothetical protein